MASRQKPATGKLMLGPTCGSNSGLRRRHLRQFAAEQHVNTIRAFRENAFARAVGPLFISRQSADVLRPVLDNFIGAGQILGAHSPGTAANPVPGFDLAFDGRKPAGNSDADGYADRQHQ